MPARLAPTFQVPYILCERLHLAFPDHHFIVFLDNLFLNISVAHCLLNIRIACMGTTRKSADGIPPQLLAVKDGRRVLVWGRFIAIIVDKCLTFAWQDNNVVLAISTAHSLHRQADLTHVLRKQPKPTASNRQVVIPLFGTSPVKNLDIPAAINDYNHSIVVADMCLIP